MHMFHDALVSFAERRVIYMAMGITSFKIEGRTVDGRLRVPMVRDLLSNIERFSMGMPLKSYLHYFSRTNREMR